MFGTRQQERAKAALKAAPIDLLQAHTPDDADHPHEVPDSITYALQVTDEGIHTTYELCADDRGVDIPMGGGTL